MINVEKLFCGAVLIVERNDGVESVSMTCLLPCGDAYDPSDRLGRAAMWSELLLRGAGELDSRAQADAFDRVGAVRSSDNGRVFVRLGATCLGSRLGETIPLIAQMIRRPLMTPESVEASREIALQAIASLEDDPQ
ncbi:MAG: insulinase family protein, partial [Planctomycetota bacterium]